jgi:hypothetical protein
MNRSTFLKRLGIGIVAFVVAPKVIAEIKPEDVVKFEPGNIFPKHDVIACVQDQLKDAGDFKPSFIVTDLPVPEINEGVYRLYIDNKLFQPFELNKESKGWEEAIKNTKSWSMEFSGLLR